MNSIGAVIVTHNSEQEIGPCLGALQGLVSEVVVVDNASGDGTAEQVRQRPGVELIANPANLGFAAAVNQGVRALSSPLVLLLNPDTVVISGLHLLRDACLESGVGAVSGRLVNPSGSPQSGFTLRRFPTPAALAFEALGINRVWSSNPVNRRYRCLDVDLEQSGEAEQPAGAFLMFRKEAWAAVGGFDEDFWPVWFEDVDFLRRLRAAGFRVLYCPGAAARHQGAHSVSRMADDWRILCWYGNFLRYVQKHFSRGGRIAAGLAVVAGTLGRMVAAALAARKDTARAYGKVFVFACLWLVSRRYREAGLLSKVVRQYSSQTAGRDLVQAHGTK
ncbi:MAG: glycosyltransferase [Bryobacteraceae bacterium]|nr:glycosyltransferase [Bryobacteraceae bacterium]